MIVNTKTLSGKDLSVNITERTLMLPIGIYAYQGPFEMIYQGAKTAYLAIIVDNNQMRVAISADDQKKIANAQYQQNQEKLEKTIPGLALVRAAHESASAYIEAFNRMMEDEQNDGVNPPKAPTHNIDELNNLYPRAALYLRAESYKCASNYKKSQAGDKAIDILLAGGCEAEAKHVLDSWIKATDID